MAIVDGKSLTFALEKDIAKTFLELAIMYKDVVSITLWNIEHA